MSQSVETVEPVEEVNRQLDFMLKANLLYQEYLVNHNAKPIWSHVRSMTSKLFPKFPYFLKFAAKNGRCYKPGYSSRKRSKISATERVEKKRKLDDSPLTEQDIYQTVKFYKENHPDVLNPIL